MTASDIREEISVRWTLASPQTRQVCLSVGLLLLTVALDLLTFRLKHRAQRPTTGQI